MSSAFQYLSANICHKNHLYEDIFLDIVLINDTNVSYY